MCMQPCTDQASPFRVYSSLTPRVPGISSRSTVTLSKIKRLLKTNESILLIRQNLFFFKTKVVVVWLFYKHWKRAIFCCVTLLTTELENCLVL